jgi:hypothetical protein
MDYHKKGQDLFSSWFHNSIPSVRSLLLLKDGHSSHYCPLVMREAALFTLPPHTTHLSQRDVLACLKAIGKMFTTFSIHKSL